MPGFQWFGRGILTKTGGLNAQGAVNTSSGITAVGGVVSSSGGTFTGPIATSSGITAIGPIVSSSGISAVGAIVSSSGITALTGLTEAVTASSSGVTLVSYGTHIFTKSADATYYLADPVVGRTVRFCGAVATGSTHSIFPLTTDVLFMSSSGTASARKVTLAGTASVMVMGTSSGLYSIVGTPYGTVAFSSST